MSEPELIVQSVMNGLKLRDFEQVATSLYNDKSHLQRRYDSPFYYAPIRRALRSGQLRRVSGIQPFIVQQFGNPVACVAAIRNLERGRVGDGYFGFFETVNQPAVAALLLQEMEAHFANLGVRRIMGPVCPDMNEFPGVLIKGHDKWNSPHTAHNHSYYAGMLEANGYSKAKDLVALTGSIRNGYDLLSRAKSRALARGVRVSAIRGAATIVSLSRAWPVYVEAHRHNWEEVPIGRSKFVSEFALLAMLSPPGFFQLATHGEEVIGFGAAIPDTTTIETCLGTTFNPLTYRRALSSLKTPKNVRVPLLCVSEKFRNRGVDAAIMHGLWEACYRAGVETGECSWILEDNHKMIGPLTKAGGKITKIWRLFEKTFVVCSP